MNGRRFGAAFCNTSVDQSGQFVHLRGNIVHIVVLGTMLPRCYARRGRSLKTS